MSLTQDESAKLKSLQLSLVKLKPRFDVCLPKNSRFDSNRLLAIVSAEIRKCPKILECDKESVEAAVSLAARLMLEPDNALGYIYFIPYGKTLQAIIGYKGLIELALRAPNVKSIYAQEVYENDHCDIVMGTEKHVKHVPCMGKRGELVAVYCVAEFEGGMKEIEFMTKSDVDLIRSRSKTGNNGPWVTDYGAMARKTVLRRMTKYIPRAVDAHTAIAVDEALDRGEKVGDYIDIEGEVVDTDTGEVTTPVAPHPNNMGSSLADKLKG